MATLTSISKNTGSLSSIQRPKAGGEVFYGWLFWFTITGYATVLTAVPKNVGSLTAIAKD